MFWDIRISEPLYFTSMYLYTKGDIQTRKQRRVKATLLYFCLRKHVVCVSLGNYIYAIGGDEQNSRVTTVERYDPAVDQWVEMASLLSVRVGCAAAVLDGYIYVTGGYDGTKCLNSVER